MSLRYQFVASPLGNLTLVASESVLRAILWENDDPRRVKLGSLSEDRKHPLLRETEKQLREYFAGHRKEFDLPLDLSGTAFQKSVWAALRSIPFGRTKSYGDIARQLSRPTAFRAVGAANGRNPVSIIVPCHRAVGWDGALTGFAGGLRAKRRLLDLERSRR